eukprot:gnl/TRDRNA2_/TRDRNA2_134591_c0_seq1.p2 gnl/TRDRNA2_/TRDRNA2_134591_c0~~gnl/TRDRNA2_/TRDRNA2_134591_c0_seq1.p2  ORF type:complete len:124 (-),score=10.11 gnl/TRDRNA2_/TRDRNA2_134591_c0_seq1:27-398(-)
MILGLGARSSCFSRVCGLALSVCTCSLTAVKISSPGCSFVCLSGCLTHFRGGSQGTAGIIIRAASSLYVLVTRMPLATTSKLHPCPVVQDGDRLKTGRRLACRSLPGQHKGNAYEAYDEYTEM